MTKRMLIDASHAEETRVVVLDGNRLEDYDVETATRRQLKGNIYLAKVVRVEPSLQAAFIEYGGNRHGFLAFGEIHPDYYQIPVADRQRLVELQEQEAREEEEEEERAATRAARRPPSDRAQSGHGPSDHGPSDHGPSDHGPSEGGAGLEGEEAAPLDAAADNAGPEDGAEHGAEDSGQQPAPQEAPEEEQGSPTPIGDAQEAAHEASDAPPRTQPAAIAAERITGDLMPGEGEMEFRAGDLGADLAPEAVEPVPDLSPRGDSEADAPAAPPETIGGEAEERPERRPPPRFMRNYKIQEVIRRRQILLVQVVKEERGTKGAALTTFVSLAGRYSVLMPNSPRGGGISRKITSAADRKRLREVITELAMPRGMGLIVRTAGANRPKPEIKRDCEYLLRLWDDIRERTMQSSAPALIYEEANLIKRTIRDVYSRDIDEVMVDGEEAWRAAREFMRMLMPSHARKVQLWSDGGQPLFAHAQVDAQLDAMLSPTVQLRSGGYLVINQTEALVAIDVNSGRSTRERGIEETALRTNLEAAEEVARQLRLRDLAGLIVIDFIDMEARKHNAMVEKRIKDALKNDRARIQLGHISHFGLLEMSRQRLRPSLAETSFVACPHCGGTGHVRSTENAALHVLRAIEEEGGKRRAAEIVVHVAPDAALYILNHKRIRLGEIEARYAMRVSFAADDTMLPSQHRIERIRAQTEATLPPAIRPDAPALAAPLPTARAIAEDEEDEADEAGEEAASEAPAQHGAEPQRVAGPQADPGAPPGETAEEGEHRRRRRRRRRRGGRREDGPEQGATEQGASEHGAPQHGATGQPPAPDAPQPELGLAPWPEEAAPPAMPALVPEAAAPELAAEGMAAPDGAPEPAPDEAPRRRQRGGRRRRREEVEPQAEPVAAPYPAPYPAPYSGPTPADPFGGQGFDIFDALEQAATPAMTPEPAPREPAPALEPARLVPETAASVPAGLPEAAIELAHVETAPPTLIDPGAALDTPPHPLAAGPAPASPPEAPPPAEPEEPSTGPAVQPVVIAAAPPEETRKRGWWRR